MKLPKGFTLIEVMITVAIVAILGAIALPSYTDYVRRGNIPDATSALAAQRIQAEQYFQDNRTYVGFPLCALTLLDPLGDTSGRNFNIAGACTATTYTFTATGKVPGSMAGFIYTIDETNTRTSPFAGAPAGWIAHVPDNCWVTSKGGSC